jgi:hypothetical protein
MALEAWMRAWGAVLVLVGCTGAKEEEEDTTDESLKGLDDVAMVLVQGFLFGDEPTTQVAALAYPDVPTPTETTDPPEVVLDSCEFESGTTGVPSGSTSLPDLLPVSAGEVTVELDGEPVPLEDPYGIFMYSGMLEGWPEGGVLSFSATGDVFPAFEVAELMSLPDNPEPVSATSAPDGSLELQWTASASALLTVLVAWEEGSLFCMLTDDGSFTIPAADLVGTGERTVMLARNMVGDQVSGDVLVQGLAGLAVIVEE